MNIDKALVHMCRTVPRTGPVKLREWVKIALLFLYVTSKLFQFTILNLSA